MVSAHRRHFVVAIDGGTTVSCVLKGRRTTLACGDRVLVSLAASGGVIEELLPRTSLIYRSDAFNEKLVAANVDQVVAVVAPDVALDLELVHRWAIAAVAEGCRFAVAANKSDQPAFADLQARLRGLAALGYPVIPGSAKRDVTPWRGWLEGRRTVLIGQSGMGKSTLLNAIAPAAEARTAEVSQALRAGRHTTTHSTLHAIPGGWIVDSPGMRAFGLSHLAPGAIIAAFGEFANLVDDCRFRDCRHDREPDCALRAAVETGTASRHRLELLRTLLAEAAPRRS